MWFKHDVNTKGYCPINKDRRKEINRAIALLHSITEKLEEAQSIVSSVADEEREYFDNMPANMQEGDKGTAADEAANSLENVRDELDNFDVQQLIEDLERAAE